jgi:5-formyltetrahydrofolate cyclo-ligase
MTRPLDEISEKKRTLRATMRDRRADMSDEQRRAAAATIAKYGLSFLDARPTAGTVVSGYAAIGDEIDPAPLMASLTRQGCSLALPVVTGKAVPLEFRAICEDTAMVPGVWGIAQPPASCPVVTPAILLVPLLAFDDDGWRLGYGGGYYDRTLRLLRHAAPTLAIGLAFDIQKIDAVPHLDYDERLDWVVTPSGPRRF